MSSTRRRVASSLTGLALLLAPHFAAAQSGGRGFLFHAPDFSLGIRGGWAAANARSDVFAFTTEQLTLDRKDFSGIGLDFDFAWRVKSRTDIVLSLGVGSSSKRSEFREYEDTDELPIEQTTSFARVPITLGVRQYLASTGRSIGRFAWIPAKVAPYVGAGAGVMFYDFNQEGDFVDFTDLSVFTAQYSSNGWTPTANAFAGVDYSVGAHVALTLQAKYNWSKANLSRDFAGFGKVDLSGMSTTAGLSIRF